MMPPLEGTRQDCDTCAYEGAPKTSARCADCSPEGRENWEESVEPAENALLEQDSDEAWREEMDISALHPLRIENAELKRKLAALRKYEAWCDEYGLSVYDDMVKMKQQLRRMAEEERK